MSAVIIKTVNAEFKFDQKEVKDFVARKKSEYDRDELAKLLKVISDKRYESFLNSDDHHYFGYVALDLISDGLGTVTCKICKKTYDACQLKEFAIGLGKSPFDINQEQKGGFSPLEKRKMPSLFGGKGFRCPEGHKLIAMETWKT